LYLATRLNGVYRFTVTYSLQAPTERYAKLRVEAGDGTKWQTVTATGHVAQLEREAHKQLTARQQKPLLAYFPSDLSGLGCLFAFLSTLPIFRRTSLNLRPLLCHAAPKQL